MAKTNTERQATWRDLQLEKKRILAEWGEHNKFRVVRREDGGFDIGLEQTPIEGERVTRELAERCGMDPEDFVQTILGEVLTEMGRGVEADQGNGGPGNNAAEGGNS